MRVAWSKVLETVSSARPLKRTSGKQAGGSTTTTVKVGEARTRLSERLARVGADETVVIQRGNKPVARRVAKQVPRQEHIAESSTCDEAVAVPIWAKLQAGGPQTYM